MTKYVEIKAAVNVYVTNCTKSVDNDLEDILDDMSAKLSNVCEVRKIKNIDIDSDDSFSVTFDVRGDGRETTVPATREEPSEYDLVTELDNIDSIFDSLGFANFNVKVEILETR